MPSHPAFDAARTDAEVLRGFTSGQSGVDGCHETFTEVR
jgi:hypothetical protein